MSGRPNARGDHEPAAPEILARHYEEGGDIERGMHYLERAGNEALNRSAQPEAMAYFLSALRLLKVLGQNSDHTAAEFSLLLRLGQAQFGALGGAAPDTVMTFERAEHDASLEFVLGDITGEITNADPRSVR